MASARRPACRLIALAGALVCSYLLMDCSFVPGPQAAPAPSTEVAHFSPVVAASAALPALTLAEDAEAKYGDYRRWSSVLVPLTTLVFPAVAFGLFVLYLFSDDAFMQLTPGSKESERRRALWVDHPYIAGAQSPMDGLVNPDDYEKGLEEAWERAKPKGSTVTVKDKLKKFSTQSNPHWYANNLSV